ncbi:transmembrane amino acid transporter protein-domain-containing protein [Zychaea mexicana]|uniref:transmembrane amino acid transporter protein-domain-containing protein n=1 Tax=Zychaea mexicana TaxID=64656 RepID=UPI0022FE905D|nr:transmembrane amino acid transporter protein-domain-containing protein [Zychaea mexicana]KAI9493525.1 transmembrane amino acid transporter protein-domain-containing protein [Zychaea mexicana]
MNYEESPPTATPASCAINLVNTILGTGLLAMPAALASIGLIPGIAVVFLSAVASGMGLYFLSRCAARTEGRNASFFAISKLTWPNLAVFFDLAIAIKCFGVAVSYLIIIGDLMPQVVASFSDHAGAQDQMLLDRRFWITVFMAMTILPLSFLRKLDSLKYTSIVALVAVVYLCAIVIYYFFAPTPLTPDGKEPVIELVSFTVVFFRRLPLFVFAFTCHQNIFSVYNELKDNSQFQVTKVISSSIGSAAGVYQAIGIMGYLTFGKDVLSNVILEYPQSPFVAGGRLAIVVLVVFSYPLQAHPCRASLDKILAWRSPEARGLKVPPPPSALKYFIMTTTILVGSYLIAITVSELDLVLAFVGSTGSTTISFILPGIFYYKIHENDPWKPGKISAVCLAIYGILVMGVCLTFNIIRVVK